MLNCYVKQHFRIQSYFSFSFFCLPSIFTVDYFKINPSFDLCFSFRSGNTQNPERFKSCINTIISKYFWEFTFWQGPFKWWKVSQDRLVDRPSDYKETSRYVFIQLQLLWATLRKMTQDLIFFCYSMLAIIAPNALSQHTCFRHNQCQD